ncbi:hypothetical protein [Enterobacter hormaechei]|uniref:Uncharacterized protein n=1 Tax=Enterobacter hormaechei TaxID=158836 RepID=A0ABD7L1P2_9ENTR|nr:hypothetical protein [Enterobacter hormaechei]ECU0714623.1 hypothetical protein [Salmonella enterica subsp. enterica serovar Kentucky]EDI2224238.1 hypothetical protein [Salmonella enterica subsp. enterica serovar Newport]EEC4769595.1 hypothetical protein [Salmonella enterica]EEE7787843.1 hypothetical protein [Salmonella enterica subsp. enterica serovar Enteritidis]HDW1501951.1 hypothetical protein [Escherichia coli]
MKVVAKYKRVEISFPHEIVSLTFDSVKDALTYTEFYKRVSLIRERANIDSKYPSELYDYLKDKGVISKELFESRQRMLRKAHLLSTISSKWM